MTDSDRYYRKPLLRMLELYVLWSIGALEDLHEQTLVKMTPHLRKIYKMDGNWHQIIASVMEFPPDLPIALQELWTTNTEIARVNNVELSPQQFAEMVVDQNFWD